MDGMAFDVRGASHGSPLERVCKGLTRDSSPEGLRFGGGWRREEAALRLKAFTLERLLIIRFEILDAVGHDHEH